MMLEMLTCPHGTWGHIYSRGHCNFGLGASWHEVVGSMHSFPHVDLMSRLIGDPGVSRWRNSFAWKIQMSQKGTIRPIELGYSISLKKRIHVCIYIYISICLFIYIYLNVSIYSDSCPLGISFNILVDVCIRISSI